MKYLLLIYSSPLTWEALPQEERERAAREHAALRGELVESGEWVDGNALADGAGAKTVRGALVVDGPFVEAKNQLAGYDLVECHSMERALEIAARIPGARSSGVEVRPVMDPGGLEM